MGSFSFQTALKQSLSFTFNNIGVLFKSALPLIAVHGLIEYFVQGTMVPGNENYIAPFVGMLIQMMLLIMFVVAWGGYYLKEIKSISFADVSNWHNVKTAYLIASLKIFLIALVFIAILSVPLIIMNATYTGGSLGGFIAIVVAIVMFGVLARLSILFGYCITTGQTSISHIWNLTKNNGVKIATGYFALVTPIVIISFIIVRPVLLSPELLAIINSVLIFVINAIITVYHINVYKQLAK